MVSPIQNLKTPLQLINQAHCFTKIKGTNPSPTMLHSWTADFKQQLRPELPKHSAMLGETMSNNSE